MENVQIKMWEKIINEKNPLRRIGCHSAAPSPGVAVIVTNEMADSISTDHSGIWQMGKEAIEIQTELTMIHCTLRTRR